jgi:hypothetical protein
MIRGSSFGTRQFPNDLEVGVRIAASVCNVSK